MNKAAGLPIETDCRAVDAMRADGADFVLLDCREQVEFDRVHISGAALLPMSQIQSRLAELEACRDNQIVVYCHHGGRSLQVAQWLRKQGFQRAQSMAGGIDQWAAEIDTSLPRY